jgi:hypothetical protein
MQPLGARHGAESMTTPVLVKPLSVPVPALPPVPREVNRLSIAHLMLWTATTAVVLTFLQAREPLLPKHVGFGSMLTSPGEDVKLKRERMRLAFWRRMKTQHVVGLVASPVYGAALAGVALAMGRHLMRRNGFPVQPGHWLLIAIAAVGITVAIVWPLLRSLPLPANAADFASMGVVTAIFAACTTRIRAPYYWRIPLGLAALGCGLTGMSALVGVIASSNDPLPLVFAGFMIGLLAIAAAPITALLCAGFDAAEWKEFDIFHWIGVATLFGVVAHFLVLWTVSHYQL